ncbi:MAG: hypothetical protein LJF04_01220, partial [Gemmatimonadetes bacterium]|nr:hypothetical protein [Gemmatimonadota bacterium]
ACAIEGDRTGVLGLIDSEYRRWAEKDFQYSEWTAQALAQVGQVAQALDWLETSVKRGNINHPFLSEKDSFLESLRGQPRFGVLMKRVREGWEAFETSASRAAQGIAE